MRGLGVLRLIEDRKVEVKIEFLTKSERWLITCYFGWF